MRAEETLLQDIFSAALGLAALLFGVFGFLYALYSTHQANRPNGQPVALIVNPLRTMCRTVSLLTVATVIVAAVALLGLSASLTLLPGVLAGVLVAITGVAAVLALYLAFCTMGADGRARICDRWSPKL